MAKCQAHRSAFDIERLVIFEDANGLGEVQRREIRFNRLKKQTEAESLQETAGLVEVRSIAEGKRERFESRRTHAQLAHEVIREDENGAAIDSAGETDADGFRRAALPSHRRGAMQRRAHVRTRCSVRGCGSGEPPSVNSLEPLGNFLCRRADVSAPYFVQVGGKLVPLRSEEARVSRCWIRTTQELNLHDVMRRHHARVAGMKLAFESLGFEPI